jgi:hypothetical protein
VVSDDADKERSSVLFRLYETLDRRLFHRLPDALELLDVSTALEDVPRVEPHAADAPSLDILICLGRRPVNGNVPLAVRHGAWSLHLGDPSRYRGEPALFWELSFGEPASTSVLEAVDHGATEHRVLYRSSTATDPVSLQRTRNPAYWKAARFMLRRLEDLAAGRWSPELEPADRVPDKPRRAPSNADAIRHMARLARRVTRRRLRGAALRPQWFLGLRPRRRNTLPHEDPAAWQVVMPPADRQWADPFLFERDGVTHLFFEEVRHRDGKGELAVARLEPGGGLTGFEPVLRAGHHLSYPYVFRDEMGTFMIPESTEARRVELWAADDFPTGWTPVATLLEGVEAVDASVFRHDDLYWMWVNQAFDGGRLDDETFLYFSDRLDGGWTPHPRNPVVSDARRARPAGRPFPHGDVIIRPAQDCTGRYGSRVVFNAVEVLTPDDYRERPVGSLGPSWSGGANLCAHTYTFDGPWEATDGLHLISRLRR